MALLARNPDGLGAAAREVEALGGEPLVLPLVLPVDVSDAAAVDRAADAVVARWGRLDVWVNDAMVCVFSPVREMKAEEFRRVIEVNYLGYVHGTLAALRHMRDQGGRGVILQVGSALAYRSIPLQSAYCASKAAIRGFTDSLRSELYRERSGIELCHLHLPAVNTPQFEVVRSRLPDHPQPVPPIYQPEVIAAAALWLVQHPRRELWVGFSTVKAILGQRLIPGLLDRYLSTHAWEGQYTRALPEGHPLAHPDNLDAPRPGDRGARGPFDARARSFSLQLWARTRLGSLGLLAPALGLIGALGFIAARRRRQRSWQTRSAISW